MARAPRSSPTSSSSALSGTKHSRRFASILEAVDAGIPVQVTTYVPTFAPLKTKEMHEFFKTQGAEPLITSPEEFHKLLVSDVEKWAKVVKASGARID